MTAIMAQIKRLHGKIVPGSLKNNAPSGRQGRLRRLHTLFVLPCGWVWRLRRYILLVAAYGLWKTMRLRRYTGLAGRQGRRRRLHILFVLPSGWFWRLRRDILLVAAYGKTMRLRRYTRPSGSQWRPQGAPTYFLFCHPGGIGPDAVIEDDAIIVNPTKTIGGGM